MRSLIVANRRRFYRQPSEHSCGSSSVPTRPHPVTPSASLLSPAQRSRNVFSGPLDWILGSATGLSRSNLHHTFFIRGSRLPPSTLLRLHTRSYHSSCVELGHRPFLTLSVSFVYRILGFGHWYFALSRFFRFSFVYPPVEPDFHFIRSPFVLFFLFSAPFPPFFVCANLTLLSRCRVGSLWPLHAVFFFSREAALL